MNQVLKRREDKLKCIDQKKKKKKSYLHVIILTFTAYKL